MENQPPSRLQALLNGLKLGADGIWSGPVFAGSQEEERKLREQVAAKHHENYMRDIAKHHSIPVMDHEIKRFLGNMPLDAVILDAGGCWGWHWRKILKQRPDVCVVIIDFVRTNLHHARNVLGPLIGTRIALVHADATMLPFPGNAFDGFWTVQTFQHIPDFQLVCREAFRVLKAGGRLANYSLHITPLVQLIYRLFGKSYHKDGMVKGLFHLSRANDEQEAALSKIFDGPVINRYTECLFHPDLKLTFTGREGSWMGRMDAGFGELPVLGRTLARQRSFEVVKP
jgi:ubiquinone/menaquinone biosynthesis C-methylase UbiE